MIFRQSGQRRKVRNDMELGGQGVARTARLAWGKPFFQHRLLRIAAESGFRRTLIT